MKKRKKITIIVLVLSLLMLTVGLVFGDLTEGIFIKAVTICTECIGIG